MRCGKLRRRGGLFIPMGTVAVQIWENFRGYRGKIESESFIVTKDPSVGNRGAYWYHDNMEYLDIVEDYKPQW